MAGKSRKDQIQELLELDPNDSFLRYGLAMEQASVTASMLAGEPSTGTRMERTPDKGSVAAKVSWYSTPALADVMLRASRHYRNAPMHRQCAVASLDERSRRGGTNTARRQAESLVRRCVSGGFPRGALGAVFQRHAKLREAVADAIRELPLLGGAQLGADLD